LPKVTPNRLNIFSTSSGGVGMPSPMLVGPKQTMTGLPALTNALTAAAWSSTRLKNG